MKLQLRQMRDYKANQALRTSQSNLLTKKKEHVVEILQGHARVEGGRPDHFVR